MDNQFDAMFGIVNGRPDPHAPVAALPAATAPLPASVPQLRAVAPAPKDDPGVFENYGWRGVVGGLSDAVRGVWGGLTDISNGIEGTIDGALKDTLGITRTYNVPVKTATGYKIVSMTHDQRVAQEHQVYDQATDWWKQHVMPDAKGTGANITRSLVSFGANFVPVARGVEAVEWTSRFAKSAALLAAGAEAAFSSAEPMQGNLANIAADVGLDKAAFSQTFHIDNLVDALKVNETDSALTARFKNAAADAVGGVAMEGAFKVLGKGSAVIREATKSRLAAQASKAAEETVFDTGKIAADVEAHADDQVAAMKGEPTAAEKASREASMAEDAGLKSEKIVAPEEPAAGGVERIGPQLEDAMAKLTPDDLAKVAKDFEDGRYFEALERTGVNPARLDFSKFLAGFADQDAAKAGLHDLVLRAAKAAEPISEYFGSKTSQGQAAAMYGELVGQDPRTVVQALADKTTDLNTYFHVASGLIGGEAQKLYQLAVKAKPFAGMEDHSPEVLALMKQWQVLTTLQGAFRGSASNVGRALRSLQDVNAATESAKGVELANSILGKAQKDAVRERLDRITEALGGKMTPRQRAAFIKQIIDTKGDVVQVAKNTIANEGNLTVAGFRALRETSANLFGISTFTNVAASIAGYAASDIVANQLVHPLAYLTRNREWVAASAAAKAQLGALGPSLVAGLQHGMKLVAHEALTETAHALDGTGNAALGQGLKDTASKLPLQDKFLREGVTRDADWYIAPDTIRDLADHANHGPAFFQAATRSLLGALGATSNAFGSLSRFGRTLTVDLADNIAGNTMYTATRWSEAVRTATKVGIDRGLFGEELGKFAQDEAKRLVSQTSGETRRALQNLVQAGSADMETLKALAQDYLDRNGIESVAEDTARRLLFQDDLKWGFSHATRKVFAKIDPGGVIAPFVTTPLRIIETGIQDFSPLGVLFKSTREQLMSGGPESVTTAAKMLLGTMLLLEGYNGAAAGRVVGYDGGPRSSARGQRPMYSQKIGDKWVDFSRFDPLSFTLGAGADLYQFEEAERARNENSVEPSPELAQLANAFYMTAVQGVLSKSWLTSLNDWVKLANPNTFFAGVNGILDGLIQRFVPMAGLQKAIEQEGTDHVVQTRTMWDRYKSNWAVAHDTLPVKRDAVLGEPIHYDRIAGFKVSGHEDDPVVRELGRLAFQLPPDIKAINGVDLTADQVERLKELQGKADLGGQNIRQALAELFSSEEYQQMTQAQKVDAVNMYRSMARSIAKDQLLFEDKDLRVRVGTQQMLKVLQQVGTPSHAIPAKIEVFRQELEQQQ